MKDVLVGYQERRIHFCPSHSVESISFGKYKTQR